MPQQTTTRVEIPIVGDSSIDLSLELDAQQCRNFYFFSDKEGKTPTALMPTPGAVEFCDLGTGPVRGIFENNGNVYALAGSSFYTVERNGDFTSIGTVVSSSGPVWWAANNQGGSPTQIGIFTEGAGYVYNISSGTLSTISDSNFQGASSMAYFSGYAVVSTPNKNLGQVSEAEDFTDWTINGEANLFSADSLQNNLVAIKDHKLELYVFDNKGAEVWVPSTDSLPIQRRDDVSITQGLAAKASIVSIDNTIYWLAQTAYGAGLAVYAYFDITQQKVSSPAFELATQSYARVDDAIAYGFSWQGSLFYKITFPTANVTWLYNIATQTWTQWSTDRVNLSDPTHTRFGRHFSNCHAFAFNKHLVGDYQTGKIYYLDAESFTDGDDRIIRERITRHVFEQNRNVFITNFEIVIQAGMGRLSGQAENPQIMLQVSNDGGHTYGPELWRPLGKQGKYFYRAVWKRLGCGRDWVFKIRISDPVFCPLMTAYADVELGDN